MKEISMSEWLEAEQELKKLASEPQPKGSITVEQYATMIGRSTPTARRILGDMRSAGLATSKTWRHGVKGTCNVYFLKPKKDWPKK